MTGAAATERTPLLARGHLAAEVEEFRARAAGAVAEHVAPLRAEADASGRFPRAAIAGLAGTGLLRERWSGGPYGDPGRGVVISEELGRAGLGGLGVGVSVHAETVLPILYRFARTEWQREWLESALDGRLVGCFASTEDGEGSDLLRLRTVARREPDGWHVHGTKAFVSLGAAADFALVLCRLEDPERPHAGVPVDDSGTIGPPQCVMLVPRDGLRVARRLKPVSCRALETVRLEIDAHVPDDALIGRAGAGLFVATWGLTHERLASSAQIVGAAELGVRLTTTHLHRRRQFGALLIERQALRLRLAELAAQATLARLAIYALAGSLDRLRPSWVREVAALKVTLARLGERMASECMHMFGGLGFLEDEAPVARMWRDGRLSRLGGGTDEMMLELVAGGLAVDDELYDELVGARE